MTALVFSGIGLALSLLYLASVGLVVWAVVDVARRPRFVMPTGQKAAWIIGLVAGWFVVGVLGGVIAAVYLWFIRPRMAARAR
jgi:hypothetical protein